MDYLTFGDAELTPQQSTSSFECDGCAHHASFHSMENKEEDEIRKRWEQEAQAKALREAQEDRPRKRLREIEYGRGDAAGSRIGTIEGCMITPGEETASETGSMRPTAKAKKKGNNKVAASASTRGSRAKGRITEIAEDNEEYIELD